ncbi:MBL fold metallo-hydrolase [Novosphingobium sediminis]|uniref:MBL fold metallo-hydrolase n=1 Tax=Novosphingobium sediminis TaxID=707214 RepID=A0A512AGX6_9SPHN|nr:MBL fold metallo-hydrolase [Novosphingobium sediminis]GEN98931.1 MBL fold metallo-hydrolase [Novosphingobium sediminis]
MKRARRKLGLASAAAWALACASGADLALARGGGDSIVLLGTSGGPIARPDRAGIATLLAIGGKSYLIDAGEGVVHQLGKAGMQAADVPTVFLTHLHDDHYAGLPALASFAYTTRAPKLAVFGPPGTNALGDGVKSVMMPSARIRMIENHLPHSPADFLGTQEFSAGVVFDDGTVRVSALANTHFHLPPLAGGQQEQSFSLKFEGHGHTIVFTGDTGPSADVTAFAKGADVLVAEMASLEDRAAVPPMVRSHMDAEHLSPLEVGKLAAGAGVRELVLTHVGTVTKTDLAVIRSVYAGHIVLGSDLARIAI